MLSFLYSPTDLPTRIWVTCWISLVLVRNSARMAFSSHQHPWLALLLVLKAPPSEMRAPKMVQTVKNPPAVRESWLQSLGREDPLEEGSGNPLQYSGLQNSMDRGAPWATVCGVTNSLTRLHMSTWTVRKTATTSCIAQITELNIL